MNAGLSNLATLKAWLLPAAMLTGTDYDDQIAALGKGVAAQLEKYCGRTFARAVADTFECSADRAHVVVPRYPLESVSAIHLRETLADGFVDQGTVNDLVVNLSEKAGLIDFGTEFGAHDARLRITYTGGFFFETLEPDDEGYPTATPAGSTALPDDLQLAWKLQCEHVWAQRDKLGLNIASKPSEIYSGALNKIELLGTAQFMLSPYRRHSVL